METSFFLIVRLLGIFRRSRADNSTVGGPIRPKLMIKSIQDFMHVLISTKFEKDFINSNRKKGDIEFLDAQGQLTS